MTTSLLKPIDNLMKGIHKTKCKDCDCFFEYESINNDLKKHKCLSCNKDYSENLKNKFKFSNNYISELTLLLKQGAYLHEYMYYWEKFCETTLPKREEFYSTLKLTHADYMHGKGVCKEFNIKNLD